MCFIGCVLLGRNLFCLLECCMESFVMDVKNKSYRGGR